MQLATVNVGCPGAKRGWAVSVGADFGVDEGDGNAVTPRVAPGPKILIPVGQGGGVVEVEDTEVLPGVPGRACVHFVSKEGQR